MKLLSPDFEADFIRHLEEFEGRTSYLYSDTTSMPTIGVGCAIPSASVCESLNWTGGIGAVALAASEWQAVKSATPGLAAASYAYLTTLRLPAAEIDRLRDQRIAGMEAEMIQAISGVATFPTSVRQACCDLSFNLGVSKFHTQYFGPNSKFGPAIYRGDWQMAAAESARKRIQPARNEYVRDLLISA